MEPPTPGRATATPLPSSLFPLPSSLFPLPSSLLAIRYSLFAILHSQFAIRNSLLPIADCPPLSPSRLQPQRRRAVAQQSHGEATMPTAADTATDVDTASAPEKPKKRKGLAFLWQVLKGSFGIFKGQDTSLRCAGTAYFGFLSFFPAIATAVLIYGLIADRDDLRGTVAAFDSILPEPAVEFISAQLRTLIDQPRASLGLGLLVSVPIALWSASRGVDALLYAMSSVRGGEPKRGFIASVATSVGMSVGGSIFLIVALLTVAGLPALLPFPTGNELLLLTFRWPVLFALTIIVISLLYRYGPDRHPRRWRYIWPGAVLSSLVWMLAGALFSIYVENFSNFEASFGSMTAAVVLLLWMYNSAQIFVFGSAFNTELEYLDTGRPRTVAPENQK